MRRAAVALGVLMTIVVGGCANGGEPPVVQEGEDILIDDPCALFTESDLEAIFDDDLGEGQGSSIEVTEGGEAYLASECRWSNEGIDLVLQVAGPDVFAAGEVVCTQPIGGGVEQVDDLGDQAWWLVQEHEQQDGLTAGLLRVCSENLLVNVLVAGAVDDPEVFEAQVRSVAEVVLTVGNRDEG